MNRLTRQSFFAWCGVAATALAPQAMAQRTEPHGKAPAVSLHDDIAVPYADVFASSLGNVGRDQIADLDRDGWVNAKDAALWHLRRGTLARQPFDGRGGPVAYEPMVEFQAAGGVLDGSPIIVPLLVKGIDGPLAGFCVDVRVSRSSGATGMVRFASDARFTPSDLPGVAQDAGLSAYRLLEDGSRVVISMLNQRGIGSALPAGFLCVGLPTLDLSGVDNGCYALGIGGATCFVDDLCLDHPWSAYPASLIVERPTGDVNRDGIVDQDDLLALSFSIGGRNLHFDLNHDGSVDALDLNLAASQLGDLAHWRIVPEAKQDHFGPGCPTSPVVTFAGVYNNTSKYFRTVNAVSVALAQQYAQRLGGYLASITGSGENSFVAGISPASMWIGLAVNHRGSGCNYGNYSLSWDSGESTAYRNWGTSCEPNNDGGVESRVAINEHRAGGWNDLPPSRSYVSVIELPMGDLRITSPVNNAVSRSSYAAVEGTGTPGRDLRLVVLDGDLLSVSESTLRVEADGRWEGVVAVGSCGRIISVSYASGLPRAVDAVGIIAVGPSANNPIDATVLLTGDVFASRGSSGQAQTDMYGAVWSHAALYVGGAADGTPEIAEAVIRNSNIWSILTEDPLGFTHTVPLEQSDVWHAVIAQVLRLRTPMNWSTRHAVGALGRSYAGRPYWSGGDFHTYADMIIYWSADSNAPWSWFQRPFNHRASQAFANANSRNKFICSTLVRATYLDSIGVDLHTPSHAITGGWIGAYDAPDFGGYLTTHNLLVVPDSIAFNPQLRTVP